VLTRISGEIVFADEPECGLAFDAYRRAIRRYRATEPISLEFERLTARFH
jgi:hypothetical protein